MKSLTSLACLLLIALVAACGDTSHQGHPLAIGAALPAGASSPLEELTEIVGAEEVELSGRDVFGIGATVFYTWTVPCPCVQQVEARLQKVIGAFPPESGIAWIAVDGEPTDTVEQIREKHLRLGGRYRMVRDPEQRLCRLLGLDRAVQVAVFDAERRLRYRGPIDDRYVEGRAEFLHAALEAIRTGAPPTPAEREPAYGCTFEDPARCIDGS